jgi:hypothetical protein
MTAQGLVQIERTRDIDRDTVMRYLLSGDDVLEGPDDVVGRYIPIVPVYGPEYQDPDTGRTRYRSVIRYSKDAQRQYNYWQTTITEKVALSPKAPWVATKEQIKGYERIWSMANRENRAFLPYNHDPAAPGPPQRTPPAAVQAGEVQQAAQAIEDIKATIGLFDPSLGAVANETSGVAIRQRQIEGDTATFAWPDNLSRSIRQVGRIIADMIPRIYDTDRIVRIRGEDGSESAAQINHEAYDLERGEFRTINDVTMGKYDIAIATGPSYQTQRQEAADSLIRFIQAVPQAGAIAMDLVAGVMDWPQADKLADRLKRALPPGVLTQEEAQEAGIQPPQPDPRQQLEVQKEALELQKIQGQIEDQQTNRIKDAMDAEGKMLSNLQAQEELAVGTNIEYLVDQAVERALARIVKQNPAGERPAQTGTTRNA